MKDAVITLPAYSAIICYLQNSKLLVNLSFFKQDCTFSVQVFLTSLGIDSYYRLRVSIFL